MNESTLTFALVKQYKDADYAQGEAYALYCNAPFFVTHNNRETR